MSVHTQVCPGPRAGWAAAVGASAGPGVSWASRSSLGLRLGRLSCSLLASSTLRLQSLSRSCEPREGGGAFPPSGVQSPGGQSGPVQPSLLWPPPPGLQGPLLEPLSTPGVLRDRGWCCRCRSPPWACLRQVATAVVDIRSTWGQPQGSVPRPRPCLGHAGPIPVSPKPFLAP